jgi:adenine C2-methylase RlmN of 23S rRNA A2503 and tRNA A37
MNEQIKSQLETAGFDYAVAVATKAEVQAGAACGQLAIIFEDKSIGG